MLDGNHRGNRQLHGHNPHPNHDHFASAQAPSHFDVMEWYPAYQQCIQFFVGHAQNLYPVQALAAFINIRLPNQRPPPPTALNSRISNASMSSDIGSYDWVSLHPYLRRLVATGFDKPDIMAGWFGEKWQEGVGRLLEQERINYLFTAKSGGWEKTKRNYDSVSDEAIPYLQQLSRVTDRELDIADHKWSKWLAMEDWMLASRSVEDDEHDTMRHH
ncbi:hypothetical protein EX30DRAFT_332177 [Ascodesmis nigricans]|uniref:Uncharacterized protein n=1 Tax=Ascodesmis nigricans TaxID=341454 RepID=A0A4S2MUT4_9PEZI|nr:hypothetical protein EX30DRAFT_332177 [Ascodesmis nigricans]